MSILEDLNSSHISIRAISVTLFLLPFWYLSVFLFANDFFKSADYFVILSFCLIVIFSSSFFLYFFIDKIDSQKSKDKILSCMSVSVMFLCLWILLLIFVLFSIKFLFKIEIYFYYFCIIYFAPIFILNILVLVFGNQENKKLNK